MSTHPAPEVAARPALPSELPQGARRVLEAAQRWGWATRATYARGTDRASDGTPKERTVRRPVDDPEQAGKQHEIVKTGEHVVVDSVLLVVQRAGERLAGAWVDGTWAYGWALGPERIATGTAMLEHIVGVPCAYPTAPRDLARAVADAMAPRKLKAGTVARTHLQACRHVAERHGMTLQALGDALRAAGALDADAEAPRT